MRSIRLVPVRLLCLSKDEPRQLLENKRRLAQQLRRGQELRLTNEPLWLEGLKLGPLQRLAPEQKKRRELPSGEQPKHAHQLMPGPLPRQRRAPLRPQD